jgi:hypothetical protein
MTRAKRTSALPKAEAKPEGRSDNLLQLQLQLQLPLPLLSP